MGRMGVGEEWEEGEGMSSDTVAYASRVDDAKTVAAVRVQRDKVGLY